MITSPTGAAVRDMLEILGRRWPAVEVWICPVRVQGDGASQQIAAALQRMLVGLSTRHYPAGLEPVGDIEQLATSKSAVSRRFVQGTEQKLAELFGRDLSQLDLLAIFIDGMLIAEHCVVVALGVDADGRKQPLGLWEGSTENKTVCNALLANLIERGLDQAWKEANAEVAQAQLRTLAKHLEVKHPGAAASLLEGLEETLTVTRLGLSPSLLRTFKSTNRSNP